MAGRYFLMTLQELNQKLIEIEKQIKQAETSEEFEFVLRQYRGEDAVISFKDFLRLIKNHPQSSKIEFGIKKIDEMTDSLRYGDLVVISGPTSQGKTTLMATFLQRLAEQQHFSVLFTYETSPEEFLQKYKKVPIGYLPKICMPKDLIWIERKIIEAKVKFNTEIVMIDHLHYLFELGNFKNSSLAIGDIIRKLKQMAQKYQVIIFLVAHLTKTQFDAKIGIEDIRDSSMVGQESDFVFIIWRLPEEQTKKDIRENGVRYTDIAVVSLEKNRRRGKIGGIRFTLKNGVFDELADEYYDQINNPSIQSDIPTTSEAFYSENGKGQYYSREKRNY